jgi:hypothetical protein
VMEVEQMMESNSYIDKGYSCSIDGERKDRFVAINRFCFVFFVLALRLRS